MPYSVSRWLLARVNRVDRQPAIFYFHPWEIDPAQPRVAGVDARTRFRHYLNLHRMEHRLRKLLFDFEWGRVDEVLVDAPQPDKVTRLPHPLGAVASGNLRVAG
jgi:uncharacterized protein DUF3473